MSVFAPLASMVDLFALRGLHRWRRGHLLPWLALYGFFLLLIASHAITGVVHQVSTRVTILDGKNLLLTWIWNVQSTCLSSG